MATIINLPFETRLVSQDASLARTLAKGMAVLEAFAGSAGALGNAEIAARIGLSRPTVARLTKTLAELGYLAYDPRTAKYRLWGGLLKLVHPLLAGMRVRQLARPLMQDFANRVRGTVSLGIADGTDMVYVETARSTEVVGQHLPDIGSSTALPRAAMGRALWSLFDPARAALTREALERAAPEVWHRFGAELDEGVRDIAARGFCVSRGGWIEGIHAAAVPLFVDAELGVPYAINCGLPAFRLSPGQLEEEIGPRLVDLARTIRTMSR